VPLLTVGGAKSRGPRVVMRAPSFKSYAPASAIASAAARAASKKSGTRCERVLGKVFERRSLSFDTDNTALPGKPDFVFENSKVVVFCDGDLWHGRRLEERLKKLNQGH